MKTVLGIGIIAFAGIVAVLLLTNFDKLQPNLTNPITIPNDNGQTEESLDNEEIPNDWETLKDSVTGVTVRHPKGWNTYKAETYGGETSIESFDRPLAGMEGIPTNELKVGIVRFSPELGAELTRPIPEQVKETKQITVAGQKAEWRVVESLGASVQVEFVRDENTYVISAYPANSIYLPDFKRMLSTVELTQTVEIKNPLPRTQITSPLSIKGQAPGNWFFEASMSAELHDQNGNVITQTPLEAKGEWMTEDLVNFEGNMRFDAEQILSDNVTLIVRAANPSGLEENEKVLKIPLLVE